MKTALIIPARFASTRFPGKVLADLLGKPIIQWVYEKAKLVRNADSIIIACDTPEVMAAAQNFGACAVMTYPNHPSGTDRVFEASARVPDAELIVNIQGDEPMIDPYIIEALIDLMKSKKDAQMGTVAVESVRSEIQNNPNCVKVVFDRDGRALYFSRSMIPYLREGGTDRIVYRHLGIYAYTRDTLERFVKLPEGTLEKCEKLEQLRALENGISIHVLPLKAFESIGIDTPEDLERAAAYLKRV